MVLHRASPFGCALFLIQLDLNKNFICLIENISLFGMKNLVVYLNANIDNVV